MKNILFPTDFSEAAMKAFIYALHLAHKYEATVTTLHVYQKPEIKGAHMPQTLQEFFETFDLHEFESYKDAIPPLHHIAEENGFSHIELKHVLEGGEFKPTILKVAKDSDATMIVMGTEGASGLKELFPGSLTGEIMEHANCPVLAVPEEVVFDGVIDHIALTTTYQEEEKLALDKVRELAKLFDAQVHCINVDVAHTEELTNRMDKLQAEYSDATNVKFQVLEGNDILETISDYVENNKVDILAMIIHKRNFIEELFQYSRTKKMAYHSKTPVLAYPVGILGKAE